MPNPIPGRGLARATKPRWQVTCQNCSPRKGVRKNACEFCGAFWTEDKDAPAGWCGYRICAECAYVYEAGREEMARAFWAAVCEQQAVAILRHAYFVQSSIDCGEAWSVEDVTDALDLVERSQREAAQLRAWAKEAKSWLTL